jgi:hypothetical protein
MKMVRPGGLELPTFWFVGKMSKCLSDMVSVTYESESTAKAFLLDKVDKDSGEGMVRDHQGTTTAIVTRTHKAIIAISVTE